MADIQITSVSIGQLISNLKNQEWLVPQFQREYVWSIGAVIEFIDSIINARPIGMVTIWEQSDGNSIVLDALSLPDKDPISREECRIKISNDILPPKNCYAILDGIQRCTSIALTFAGFHTNHMNYHTSGRFFLNVATKDPTDQIIFIKENDVIRNQLNKDSVCFSLGYFPFSSNNENEDFLPQWMRYTQELKDPSNYEGGKLPPLTELNRRDSILKKVFDGLIKTKLAVYIVPDSYSLADICDIFQTLNTTGTKVSTVDLIHSWLYSDTYSDSTEPIQLREWIDDLGQKDGMIGWADSTDRPELIVQMATATHIALDVKTEPRKIGKPPLKKIESIKSGDLLATPTEHWKLLLNNEDKIAGYFRDFQTTVAGGLFPWRWCPYPATSSIYVSLRFHFSLDSNVSDYWSIDDLNALFRAFFWQNCLTTRYDQGFLTQLGTDIITLKNLLYKRREHKTGNSWAREIETDLHSLIEKSLPDYDDLFHMLTRGRNSGAIHKALTLPMLAKADNDLLNDNISLKYTGETGKVQLHHIYPRDWCKNNMVGQLANLLDPKVSEKNWAESISNLMPLSRESNNVWKSQNPGQVLAKKKIDYNSCSTILKSAYINEETFNLLLKGAEGMEDFFSKRANLLTHSFLEKMKIVI